MSAARGPCDAVLCDAALILGFGGPATASEIRPFLDRVLAGRPVPRERYEAVVHHYELMGGRSPYNEHTNRLAEAVRASLRAGGREVPVAVGLRHSAPFIGDAIAELARAGSRRAFAFVLAPHRCEASWDRYLRDIAEACESLGGEAPAIDYPAPWHDHPGFIAAAADRVRAALARLDADERARAALIFTAHSVPVAMAARAGYSDQIEESSRLVASAVDHPRYSVAFQSRSESPREAWLEPDINDAIRALGGRPAVVMPIGFLCDHVEVLYDLDIAAAQCARDAGVRMVRAGTVGDHPRFLELIASIARAAMAGGESQPTR
jgi:ferrochelatase